MKLLAIALDGGDQQIIEAMDMPFLKRFIASNVVHPLSEDLLERGWAKVLTGVGSERNNALYSRPMLDGTVAMTQGYNTRDLTANPDVTPIWDRLNEGGIRVGFLNLPLTSPCPTVDGFVVAGGGGGVASAKGLDPAAIAYPPEAAADLEELGFDFDLRPETGEVSTTTELVARLNQMARNRTQVFGHLCSKYPVDFGLICYRPPTVIQYLARKDIQDVIDGKDGVRPAFREQIREHYRVLDEAIADAVAASNAERVLLVSDHGAAPYRLNLCLNTWLEQQGYLSRGPVDRGLKRQVIALAKAVLPKGLAKSLKKSGPGFLKNSLSAFEPRRTRAFGPDRILGIYVNDDRFMGVVDPTERDELVDEIVARINADQEFRAAGLSAVPFRRAAGPGPFERSLPDVGFGGSSEVWPVEYGPLFSPNSGYANVPESIVGIQNPNAGVKGRNALLVTDNELASLVGTDDEMDLTLAYKLIVRSFGLAT